jgi:hypothetical protein
MPVEKTQVVKSKTNAHNHKYASLADIASEGHKIPIMRIKPTPDGDYVEYLDDKGEWQTGARVVTPDMKGCNDAQKYGAAVTYARRYTVQLALGLAADDDDKIENQSAEDNDDLSKRRLSFDEIKAKLDTLNTISEINAFAKDVSAAYPNPTDKQRHAIQTMFSIRREEITEARLTHARD